MEVVVCPRANGIVGAGVPRVAKMLDLGCIIGIGTDNVMLNSPDILRELDYIWKAIMVCRTYLSECQGYTRWQQ